MSDEILLTVWCHKIPTFHLYLSCCYYAVNGMVRNNCYCYHNGRLNDNAQYCQGIFPTYPRSAHFNIKFPFWPSHLQQSFPAQTPIWTSMSCLYIIKYLLFLYPPVHIKFEHIVKCCWYFAVILLFWIIPYLNLIRVYTRHRHTSAGIWQPGGTTSNFPIA